MSSLDSDSFDNLGKFCDDDYEDEWEQNEAKAEYISERYQDREFIASGALKNVYKVFDRKMQRHIALAELKEEIPEEEYEAFFNEASLTSSLRHPNIITVHDFGFNDVHIPYFTMALKVGDTLGDIIKKADRNLNERLEIFMKICDAIAYSHSRNVIHLDLKPANIQVGEFGEVQVCDWGLSKKGEQLKTGDKISGTPGFMAPEQIIEGELIDKRTDIYAMGAILYAILTDHAPHEGSIDTVISKTADQAIEPPGERFPDKAIPESLNAVVCKAMAVAKTERYQTVDALRQDVSQYLLGRSTSAENAGFLKELSLFVKRNKQVCTISFIFIAALLSAAVIFMLEIQESKAETERTLLQLEKTHKDLLFSRKQEKQLFEEKETAFKEREAMYSQLLGEELKQAYDLMTYPLYYSSPQQNLNKSLTILESQYDPEKDQPEIRELIFMNRFISQKYDELEKYKSDKTAVLLAVSNRFKHAERTPIGLLNDKDFTAMLEAINALPDEYKKLKRAVMERCVAYLLASRKMQFATSHMVRELLKCWNAGWDQEQFRYDRENYALKISGSNLSKLTGNDLNSSKQSFLRYLRIDSLDIRNTGVSRMNQLTGTSINRLDIRDTKIGSLHPHNVSKNMKEIYISSGQFSEQNELMVPVNVKLIYK